MTDKQTLEELPPKMLLFQWWSKKCQKKLFVIGIKLWILKLNSFKTFQRESHAYTCLFYTFLVIIDHFKRIWNSLRSRSLVTPKKMFFIMSSHRTNNKTQVHDPYFTITKDVGIVFFQRPPTVLLSTAIYIHATL